MKVLAVAILLGACGGGEGDGPIAPANELVFARGDGTVVVRPADTVLSVTCGPLDGDVDPRLAIQIFEFSPSSETGWSIAAALEDVEVGPAIALPTTDIQIFLNDPPNELSGSDDDASGTITLETFDCETGVELSIDATLGSEFGDLENVRVTGTFASFVD
jgi:hypothetical protein